jgi:hypothetical protein
LLVKTPNFSEFGIKSYHVLMWRLIIGNSVNCVIRTQHSLFGLGCWIFHLVWYFCQIALNVFTVREISVILRQISSFCMMFLSDCAESVHSAWFFLSIALNEFTLRSLSATMSWISIRGISVFLCIMGAACVLVFFSVSTYLVPSLNLWCAKTFHSYFWNIH